MILFIRFPPYYDSPPPPAWTHTMFFGQLEQVITRILFLLIHQSTQNVHSNVNIPVLTLFCGIFFPFLRLWRKKKKLKNVVTET